MKTREDYDLFLKEARRVTGIEGLLPDETSLVSLRVWDEFTLNLQFVEKTGGILCFVEVAQLPEDADGDVYRDLLVGGLFGKETAGGYFALDSDTETVVYNYVLDLETVSKDVHVFISILEEILRLCAMWAERIGNKTAKDGLPDNRLSDNNFCIQV